MRLTQANTSPQVLRCVADKEIQFILCQRWRCCGPSIGCKSRTQKRHQQSSRCPTGRNCQRCAPRKVEQFQAIHRARSDPGPPLRCKKSDVSTGQGGFNFLPRVSKQIGTQRHASNCEVVNQGGCEQQNNATPNTQERPVPSFAGPSQQQPSRDKPNTKPDPKEQGLVAQHPADERKQMLNIGLASNFGQAHQHKSRPQRQPGQK